MDENNPDDSAEHQRRGRVAERGPETPRRRLIISRNSSVLSNGNLDRSRSPLCRLPLVNLSDIQAGLEELGGVSATPIRGPNRFMPVLSGLGVFKVPFPIFPPPPEPVIPASHSEPAKNSIAHEPHLEHTKFLVNWVPRLHGKKLIVEGNLLDLSAENPFATVDRWRSSRLISVDKTGTKVSTSRTTYVLEGKLCLGECDELTPSFIKVAFRNGFPQNWKLFQDQWRTFVKGQLDNDRSSNATCTTVQSTFFTEQQQQQLLVSSVSVRLKKFQPELVSNPPTAGSVVVADKNLPSKSPQNFKSPFPAAPVVKTVATESKSPLKVSAMVVDDRKNRTEERKKLELQRKEEAKKKREEQRKLSEQKKEEKQREAKRIREEKKQETERKKKEAGLARERKKMEEKERKEAASRSREKRSRSRTNNFTFEKDSSRETRIGVERQRGEQQKACEDDELSDSDMEKPSLVGVEKTKQTKDRKRPELLPGEKEGKKMKVSKVPVNEKKISSNRPIEGNEKSKALCGSSSADFIASRLRGRPRKYPPAEPIKNSSAVVEPKRRGRKPKSYSVLAESVVTVVSPKHVTSQTKPVKEIQEHPKSPIRGLPQKTGFNPNPKTAADYRRNTQVMQEIDKNHEDVIFQLPAKRKPKDVPPGLCIGGANAIRGELFNSDSENDYSVHSARTPIRNYFDKSDTETTKMEDVTEMTIGRKDHEFQHHAFINRQLKDGRKASKKHILKLDPVPPPRQITKKALTVPQLLAGFKQIKEIRRLPTDAIGDDESDADQMSSYFTDDQSLQPESMSSVPAGLLELYENQKLEDSKNPNKQNPRKKFYF